MSARKSVVASAIGGSIAAAAVMTVVIVLWVSPTSNPSMLSAAPMWILLNALICSGFSCSIGLLWHGLAQRRRWTSAHAYWAPGAIAGGLISGLFFLALSGGWRDDIYGVGAMPTMLAAYGACCGGLTGLFAWLLHRPDRNANPDTSGP